MWKQIIIVEVTTVTVQPNMIDQIFYAHTWAQAAPIRLPDCPGQSLFVSGNNDLHYTCSTGK